MTSRPWTFRAAAIGVALAAATATVSTYAVAQADDASAPRSTTVDRHDPAEHKHDEHNLEGPLSKTQEAQRQEALNQVLSGKSTVKNREGSKVVQLKSKKGDSKYVELGREKTDKIFTILVEFGDQIDSKYGGTPGPLHNQIAKPDRKKDNSTAWRADYNQKYFEDLYFGTGKNTESVKKYYEKQSSGRYSVEGEVSDWVKVPYNEARYGNNACGDTNCPSVWNVVSDGLNAWVAQQKAAGKTDAEIKADVKRYDQWDRYDFDGDGDFNESDGYIDHFQVVHAGEDESAGGGAQGTDAIWAHRWYAFGTDSKRHRPRGQQARRREGRRHRHLGRRLHRPAGERRTRRLRPRVRPRPRPAGPLRHLRRRRQLHRLLDPDVLRLLARHRQERDRRPARRHDRLGQAPAGLAQVRHREGRDELVAQAGCRRVQHEAQAGPRGGAAQEGRHHRDRGARAGRHPVVERQRRQPQELADPFRRPHRQEVGVADLRRLVRHRVQLRLPLRRGVDRRRCQLDGARRHGGRSADPA